MEPLQIRLWSKHNRNKLFNYTFNCKARVIIFDNLQTVFSSPPAINHMHWVTLLLPKVLVTSPKPGITAWACWKGICGNFPTRRSQASCLVGIWKYFLLCFRTYTQLNGVTDVSSTKSFWLGCLHRVRENILLYIYILWVPRVLLELHSL